ncbi:MAG TPA: [FeFe] hydrogenase H-cluster maturation GTPase HydF [Eubacteriales bacterium]|nr:[FeFe] hydrogenase H-cluster maturation GTPase HydF [Clostridia bacterium]HRV73363.1 [FeFe] hydrogenase H-cluster maturation GTPase HydF [Eubacteriales bacterium]
MGLNDTPSGERLHIGFFGRRNAGKSSLVNAVTGQSLAIVSDTKGTTTDPVFKSMELLPLGPVVIIDTPGFDDEGELGGLRVKKAKQVLNKTDIAVLVADASLGLFDVDRELIRLFIDKGISYVVVMNKSDLAPNHPAPDKDTLYCSALKGEGIFELKERLAHLVPAQDESKRLVGDLIKAGDTVVLVIPIDSAAPKGRLILPQQQVIRDVLEADGIAAAVKEDRLKEALSGLKTPPAMVITDSQAFRRVSTDTPSSIPLTSFSILMARYKGTLEQSVKGAAAIDRLKDGDTVLISEGCTHHRQCGDIGTVKIPRWLAAHCGCKLNIETTSGTEFPDDLSKYAVILHCGGCMLNEREMRCRYKCAMDQGVPMTNYGVVIAHMNGILKRSLSLFPDLAALL